MVSTVQTQKKDPNATRYTELTYDEVINNRLAVMDTTAVVMCQEQKNAAQGV